MGEHIIVAQGSPEWHAARCGSVGASELEAVMAKGRNGAPSATRLSLIYSKLTERLTGLPGESYTNAAMQWGIETEAKARAAYALDRGVDVVTCGLFRHHTLEYTHASPDGLVGDTGLLEVKCPNSKKHIETLDSGEIDRGYILQMQWQMECTGQEWCDFVSFDPRLPASMQLFVRRIHYDAQIVDDIAAQIAAFNRDTEAKMADLRRRYA